MREILAHAQRLAVKHPESIFIFSCYCEVEKGSPTDLALLVKVPNGETIATLTICIECGLPVSTFRVKKKLSPEELGLTQEAVDDFVGFASKVLPMLPWG